MRRRDLILAAAAAVACPDPSRAQQKTMPVIGILGLSQPDDPAIGLNLAGLRRGLKQGGFVEGQNCAFEYRWAHGDEARLPALAAELVVRRVDVIVTEGAGSSTTLAAKAASKIPVVFHTPDAIADGVVSNLAHPGGNATGVSLFAPELLLKQLGLLRDVIPQAKVISLLVVPKNQVSPSGLRQIEEAARASGVRLQTIQADLNGDLEAVYAALPASNAGIVVRANATLADRLVALAARYGVPAVYGQRAFSIVGGLISYGVSIPAVYAIKGFYAAKILSGAKPGDLPVEQPTKFELIINLKTAKALGLTVPQLLLAQADEVIE